MKHGVTYTEFDAINVPQIEQYLLESIAGKTSPQMLNIGNEYGSVEEEFLTLQKRFKYNAMEYSPTPYREGNVYYDDVTTCEGIPDNSFDFVFATNVLEHVKTPWTATKELARITTVGGIIVIIAPFKWRYHAMPDDFWRFTPTGLNFLFEDTSTVTLAMGWYAPRVEVASIWIGQKQA